MKYTKNYDRFKIMKYKRLHITINKAIKNITFFRCFNDVKPSKKVLMKESILSLKGSDNNAVSLTTNPVDFKGFLAIMISIMNAPKNTVINKLSNMPEDIFIPNGTIEEIPVIGTKIAPMAINNNSVTASKTLSTKIVARIDDLLIFDSLLK